MEIEDLIKALISDPYLRDCFMLGFGFQVLNEAAGALVRIIRRRGRF